MQFNVLVLTELYMIIGLIIFLYYDSVYIQWQLPLYFGFNDVGWWIRSMIGNTGDECEQRSNQYAILVTIKYLFNDFTQM